MGRLFERIILGLFAPISLRRGAVASSAGFMLGILPIHGIRLPLLFFVSVIFRLNIFALLLGAALPIFIPIFKSSAFLLAYGMEGHSLSVGNIRFWLFSHWRGRGDTGPYLFSSRLIAGAIFSIMLFPLFQWFYRLGLSEGKQSRDFIFFDGAKKRWKIIKRLAAVALILSIVIGYAFYVSMNNNPVFQTLPLKGFRQYARISPVAEGISDASLVKQLKEKDKQNKTYQLDYKKHQLTGDKKTHQEVYAFYVNWDENSKTSLEHHLNKIDTLIPEWFHLNSDLSLKNESDKSISAIAKGGDVKITPLLNNYVNNNWDEKVLHQLLSSPEKENKLLTKLLYEMKKNGYSGINIDFEGADTRDQKLLVSFMEKVSNTFHQNHLQVTEDVPASDPAYDYKALASASDRLIVMTYDEHYSTGRPGPVASADWVQQTLDNIDVPQRKMVVALGNYGYDWTEKSKQPADNVTFGDIMDMASATHLTIKWDTKSGNPYVRYMDGNEKHTIWFLDAAAFYNEMRMTKYDNAKGIALWRLGSEDPAIWNVIRSKADPVKALSTVVNPNPVHYSGSGEVLRIISSSNDGMREIKTDNDDFVTEEIYKKLPTPYEVERYGKPKDKKIVLSFDDGPDPKYTPQILDILDRYHIKGSFFIVGENAELHPELIQRMYSSGDEIGSHTFTHPNVAAVSPLQTKMELNANQRLFQEITGHSMTMFRPPYVADAEPSAPNELLPILRAQEMGYTMIGELIDPEDWQKPSSSEIIKRVLRQLPQGNIILLHDAGGDRNNTVKALPGIIEALKNKGYSFTTIGDLTGLKPNEIMPKAGKDSQYFVYDKAVFTAMRSWHDGISFLFFSAIIIGVLRLISLVYLSRKQHKKYSPYSLDESYFPHVSVVIAAYNEEKVIKKTIQSILGSSYPSFDLIVVNDGSKDKTGEVVAKEFENESRVQLINKSNGGKSSAVNLGFKKAKGEIIITLDADTIIAENAISLMVRHFKDQRVAAVSGNVKVGNVRNLLTKWQQIEYVTGFNLERRAFAELNCVTVVPGAIGAWRKKAAAEAGYFKEDTLAEDTDITLALLRKGYIISYEEKAYAYTEAPEDIKSLIKQRYRWTYGTLQCLWKHREAMLNKKQKSLGYVGLPNMWLFQYIYQSFSPVADILFILALFGHHPLRAAAGFVLFYLVDFLASLHAFKLEKENPKTLVWLFLQRIIYKQFMTYTVLKSIYSAIKGNAVGWNKLKRNGNVKLSELQPEPEIENANAAANMKM